MIRPTWGGAGRCRGCRAGTCSKKIRPDTGLVEHSGQAELGLQDRQLVAVAGGLVVVGERVGQDSQPLAQQRVDLRRSEAVANALQRRYVVDCGEPVVEGLEPDPGLGRLAFAPTRCR